jgi:hypothetical protein
MIRFTDFEVTCRLPDSVAVGHELRKTEYFVKRWNENAGLISRDHFVQSLPESIRHYCASSSDGGISSRPDASSIGAVLLKSFDGNKRARRGSAKLAAALYGKLLALGRGGDIGTVPETDAGSFPFEDGMVHYRLAVVSVPGAANSQAGWLGIIDWSVETTGRTRTIN